jgi:L-malate glycosyltransferase
LKVLFITSWYPTKAAPSSGVFVREHAKAVRLYDEVAVLHSTYHSAPRPLWLIEQEDDSSLTQGLPTYRYSCYPVPVRGLTMSTFIAGGIRMWRQLSRLGFRPNMIHAHEVDAGLLAVWLGRLYDVPVVVTEHSSVFPRKLLPVQEVRKAKQVFMSASLVLPVSKYLQLAIESYGIHGRYRIVPNTVDLTMFHPTQSRRAATGKARLLFVGFLTADHVKGVPYLLQALEQLRHRRGDWHLDIVGGGPSQAEYEQFVAEAGLASYVTFHGTKPKAVVAEFMAQADAFVLPSIWETMGCVLIEALASGLPVLASKVGGIPEIIDDAGLGLLVSPADPPALAQGLDSLLHNLDQYDRSTIRKAAQRYSYESIGSELHAIYEECQRK